MFKTDMISKSASGRNDTRQDFRVPGGAPSLVLQEPDLQVGLVPYADTNILPTQKPTTWCTCKPVCSLPRASWDQELQKRGTWDCIKNITGRDARADAMVLAQSKVHPTCHIPHHLRQWLPPCSPMPCLRKPRKPTHKQCTVRAKLEQCNRTGKMRSPLAISNKAQWHTCCSLHTSHSCLCSWKQPPELQALSLSTSKPQTPLSYFCIIKLLLWAGDNQPQQFW